MSAKHDKAVKTFTQGHQVSLKRPDGWYGADNEMVTVFAPLIGPYAFSVYHLLKQRSFLKEKERGISQAGISLAMGMSKDSAGNALQTLKRFYLVEEKPSTAPNKPPQYEVVHAKDVLAAHPEFRTPGEFPQFPQERPEIRTRVRTKRVLKSGRGVGEIQDATVLNSGCDRPEFRTPNKEVALKDRRQKQDNTPLPPKGGGKPSLEVQDETQNATAMATAVVRGVPEVLAGGADRRERATTGAAPGKAPTSQGARDGMTPVAATLAKLLGELKVPKPTEVERAEVVATPRQQALFFLQELHDQFAQGFGMSSMVAKTKGANWEDPHTAWKRCFDHVGVGEIEADGEAWMVLLETPRPRELADGLTKYAAKVQIAMKKAFGREVQLVPRLEAM